MTAPMHDLTLCDWRVHSTVPLPALRRWSGDDRAPDITIRTGRVTVPDDLPFRRTFMGVGADGTGWVTIPDVLTLCISGGTEIIVDPQVPMDAPDIGLFVLGSGFGLLCHQRQILPIHGSCIELDGRAVLFCGPSGQGKSTLAAALVAQGLRLLSDDVTPVHLTAAGQIVAMPSFPRQKLWQDSLNALHLPPGNRLRQADDFDKFEQSVDRNFCDTALPLAAVFGITTAHAPNSPVLTPLRGMHVLHMLRRNVYRGPAAPWLRTENALFRDLTQLAAAVPTGLLHRPPSFDALEDFASALPEHLRAYLARTEADDATHP